MAEKVTTMVLKVDLQCSCCYKKIKKILAKFPEIRSPIYDEKQNTVTITVECCNPEKIRCKLWCKGGKTIKCIEIKEPLKPPQGKKTKGKDDEDIDAGKGKKTKGKDDEDKDTGKPSGGKTKVTPPPPKPPVCGPAIGYPPSCPGLVSSGPYCDCNPGAPCYRGCGRPVPIPLPVPIIPKWVPAHGCPPNPVPDCCGSCSEGNRGGPCYHGCGSCGPCSEGNRGGPCCRGCGSCGPCSEGNRGGQCCRGSCGPCSEGNRGRPCSHGCGRPAPCYDGSGSGYGGCTSM